VKRTALAIAAFCAHLRRCRACHMPRLCPVGQGLLMAAVKIRPLKKKPCGGDV